MISTTFGDCLLLLLLPLLKRSMVDLPALLRVQGQPGSVVNRLVPCKLLDSVDVLLRERPQHLEEGARIIIMTILPLQDIEACIEEAMIRHPVAFCRVLPLS